MPALQGNRGGGSFKGHVLVDKSSNATDDDALADPFVQNIFVLRHGEAISSDNGAGGDRPWDPPLSDRGKLQAWQVGRNFRMEEWNITRIVISPFLRCVQTAAEVIAGFCLGPSSVQVRENGSAAAFPPSSSIKVSIECGLVDMMPHTSRGADKNSFVPWTLNLSELYSLLPQEVHDTSFEPVRQMLSLSREVVADAQYSHTSTLQKIANNFHTENILCITYDEGVMQSALMMWPRVEIYEVTHCAYTHAQRPNFKRDMKIQQSNFKQNNQGTVLSGEWELITESGIDSGIFFHLST